MKKLKPLVVKAPKKRIPIAPPSIEHRDRKVESTRLPSGRRAKHKKKIEERIE